MPGDARRAPRRHAEHFEGPATDSAATTDGARPAALRQLRINTSDLKEHDHHDPHCQQCRSIQRSGRARAGGQHTDACRKALIEKMKLTERGRARLKTHDDRTTQIMAENIERADQQGHAPAEAASSSEPRTRGFLEKAPEVEPAGPARPRSAAPPETARVRFAEEAIPAAGPRNTAENEWQDVRGGSAAPLTPRGTPLADEPTVRDEEAAAGPEDEAMPGQEGNGDVEMDFVGCIDHTATGIGSLEPNIGDFVSELLLAQMGSSGRQYRRESVQAARRIVSEI